MDICEPFTNIEYIQAVFEGDCIPGTAGNPPMGDELCEIPIIIPITNLQFTIIRRVNYKFCPIPINHRQRQLILTDGNLAYKDVRRVVPCYADDVYVKNVIEGPCDTSDPDAIADSITNISITSNITMIEESDTNIIFSFLISLQKPLNVFSTITWEVLGFGINAATPMDFIGDVFPKGVAAFPPGKTERSISITIKGDSVSESDKSFKVMLKDPSINLVIIKNSIEVILVDED